VSAPTYYRMRSKGRCPECGKRTADRCPTCGTLHRGVYCRECRAYHRKRLALKRADNRAAYNAYMRDWKAKRRLLEVNLG